MSPRDCSTPAFVFEQRPSESAFVERVWRTNSSNVDNFQSVAVNEWEIVVTRIQGQSSVVVRGPETRPTVAHCPADAEFFGIAFKVGTLMPRVPPTDVVNGMIVLPAAGAKRFWVNGSAWEIPSYDNADTFVARLVRNGLVVRDQVVTSALDSRPFGLSDRSVQRHFVRVVGLTQTAVRQIARARRAVALLREGLSIVDVVDVAGYADQPHLTRSLRRFIGQTPSQVIANETALSLIATDGTLR